jgi:DNA-binding winged helix-turn-helix (wHTH) protein/tetratricopeptide (TPR) repeat protein
MPDHLLTRTELAAMTEISKEQSESYEFSKVLVDADRRELLMENKAVTVQPKAFELLLYLIRNRHRAVNKDELQDALWPRSIVTETALTRCVMKARRAVGDDADKQAIIKTIHGHGYRFTAKIITSEDETPALADSVAPRMPRPPRKLNLQALKVGATTTVLFAAIVFAWTLFSPPALSGPIRLAVLPIENATGDPDMDWVSTGLMALMNRMLQDGGIDTVSAREVAGLAGDAPLAELIATGSEFRLILARTAAATHVIAAKLEDNNGLYRLTYTLAGADKRPTRRTMVGQEPTKLVKDVVSTVTALIVDNPPPLQGQTSVSNDEFVNEAYARAMALYQEGRYEEAKGLFDLIIEQEPHLFWPRYERALTIRNLRDFEGAERELTALRSEVAKPGMEREQAGVENALGVIYWSKRRHDEARVAFEKMTAISLQADKPLRAATGYQNLGLVEKSVGNVSGALTYMQKAEQVYGDMDIQMMPGSLLNNMSGVLIQMGHFVEAQEYSLRAIESFRLTGERRNEATAMNRLSDIYARQRYYDEAIKAVESSLAVRRELDDQYGIGSSLINIADIASQRGNFTRALQHAMQAYDIGVDIDSVRLIVPALIRIARAETRLGDPDSAAARYAEVESIARQTEDPQNVFRARLGLAETKIELGLYDDALTIATELLNEARDKDRQRDETAAMRLFSRVYSATGRHQEALQILEEAFGISKELDDSVVLSSLHIRLAEEYLAIRDAEAAATHVALAARQRPEDADSLKVQALYEATVGNVQAAATLMGLARTNAGEGWNEADAAMLAAYRAAAGTQ